jgi:hypothetical protein
LPTLINGLELDDPIDGESIEVTREENRGAMLARFIGMEEHVTKAYGDGPSEKKTN